MTVRIGDSEVHLGTEFPAAGILSPLSIGGTATVLHISTDDADSLWRRALAAGGEVHHELADQFWGERHGQLTDPFGHRWNVGCGTSRPRSSPRPPRRRSGPERCAIER